MKEPQQQPCGLNTCVFFPGDRVEIKMNTMGKTGITGEVVGVSMRHIIDIYIVLLDEPLESGWRACAIPSSGLIAL